MAVIKLNEGYEEESLKESAYNYTYTWDDDFEPEDDYEKELKSRSGQKCRILKDNGNGNYEIEFKDGSQYDATDDEISADDLFESSALKEYVEDGNKVLQVTFDVEVPKNVDLNVQAMSGNTEFYKKLSEFLSSLGYEMAGDGIDTEDVTSAYKVE